jgi:hypothetical protein
VNNKRQLGQEADSAGRSAQLQARRRSRERMKVIGLIAIALFILLLGLVRFGKTIPWSAR